MATTYTAAQYNRTPIDIQAFPMISHDLKATPLQQNQQIIQGSVSNIRYRYFFSTDFFYSDADTLSLSLYALFILFFLCHCLIRIFQMQFTDLFSVTILSSAIETRAQCFIHTIRCHSMYRLQIKLHWNFLFFFLQLTNLKNIENFFSIVFTLTLFKIIVDFLWRKKQIILKVDVFCASHNISWLPTEWSVYLCVCTTFDGTYEISNVRV